MEAIPAIPGLCIQPGIQGTPGDVPMEKRWQHQRRFQAAPAALPAFLRICSHLEYSHFPPSLSW